MPSCHPSPFLPFPLSTLFISSFPFLFLLLSSLLYFLLFFLSTFLKVVSWMLVSLVDYEHDARQLTSSLVSNTCESCWLWSLCCTADLNACIILLNWNCVLLKNSIQFISTLLGSSNHHSPLCFREKQSKRPQVHGFIQYCHSVYICLRSNDALKFHLCCHLWQDIHPLCYKTQLLWL